MLIGNSHERYGAGETTDRWKGVSRDDTIDHRCIHTGRPARSDVQGDGRLLNGSHSR